ncbi:MAG: hypothetical protein RLZZ58_2102 [Pseudomonadota bacterium]
MTNDTQNPPIASALIDGLVADLNPVRPMRFANGMLLTGAAALLTIFVSARTLGLRSDLFSGYLNPVYVMSLGLTLLLAIAASVAVIQMSRPHVGNSPSGWGWAAAMAAVLPIGTLVTSAQFYANTGTAGVDGEGGHCLYTGVLLGTMSAAALTLWLRRGAPTSPTRAGWLTGLAGGSIGIFALALYCPYDDIGHIGFWHGLSVVGSALLGRLIVPPLIRW